MKTRSVHRGGDEGGAGGERQGWRWGRGRGKKGEGPRAGKKKKRGEWIKDERPKLSTHKHRKHKLAYSSLVSCPKLFRVSIRVNREHPSTIVVAFSSSVVLLVSLFVASHCTRTRSVTLMFRARGGYFGDDLSLHAVYSICLESYPQALYCRVEGTRLNLRTTRAFDQSPFITV